MTQRSSSPVRSSRSTSAKGVVLGIRRKSLEDASLEPDTPRTSYIKGVVLREPLGSEIIAHFEVDAPPALTEDVRELARDVGSEGTVQAPSEGDTKTTLVGRFGPRSRVKSGDVIDVAVDTRAVHLFDAETSARHLRLGGYGKDKQTREGARR